MHSILILLHLVKIAQVLQVCYGVSMYIQKENNFLFNKADELSGGSGETLLKYMYTPKPNI